MNKLSKRAKKSPKKVQNLSHPKAKRKNIPTAQHQSFNDRRATKTHPKNLPAPAFGYSQVRKDAFQRRNIDLDPQLIWRGKENTIPVGIVVNTAPLYIQEKVRPQAIVEELLRQSAQSKPQSDRFFRFNGLSANARTEFYQHEGD